MRKLTALFALSFLLTCTGCVNHFRLPDATGPTTTGPITIAAAADPEPSTKSEPLTRQVLTCPEHWHVEVWHAAKCYNCFATLTPPVADEKEGYRPYKPPQPVMAESNDSSLLHPAKCVRDAGTSNTNMWRDLTSNNTTTPELKVLGARIEFDPVQAKEQDYPVPDCATADMNTTCENKTLQHIVFSVYMYRDTCELWEGVKCVLLYYDLNQTNAARYIPIGKPVAVDEGWKAQEPSSSGAGALIEENTDGSIVINGERRKARESWSSCYTYGSLARSFTLVCTTTTEVK